MERIRFLPLYMSNVGTHYHRVRLPTLCSAEYVDHSFFTDQITADNLVDYFAKIDLVLWNRNCPFDLSKVLELRDKYGFKIVVDTDDWWELPTYHPQYREYKEQSARIILESIKVADLVTVTTWRLAEKVKSFNKNVAVIPNAIPFGAFQFVPNLVKKPPQYNFVYAGQTSHYEDIQCLAPALKRFSKEFVTFSMCGYQNDKFVVNNNGKLEYKTNKTHRRMNDIVSAIGPERLIKIENRPLDHYMTVYDKAHCSVAPLCVNEFNFHKSNLKVLEAAAKLIPIIVSNIPPYRDDKDAPIVRVDHPGDWYKHMKKISESQSASFEMGCALHEWAVAKYDMRKWNKYRFELFRDLVDEKVLQL